MASIKLKINMYDSAVGYGYCSADKIANVKKYAADKNCQPARAFIETGTLTDDALLRLQGQIYGYKIISDVKKVKIDNELITKFDTEKLLKLKMFPFSRTGKLKVAITEPVNSVIIEDYIKEVLGRNTQIEFHLISGTAFAQLFDNSGETSIEYDLDQLRLGDERDSNIYDITTADTGAVVILANKIFFKAVRMKASDVHIEPCDDKMRIRFRVDGLLQNILETPKQIHSQLINRIKTMADMDINNNRIFQGGSIRLKIYGSHIDVRVSSLPTVYGEKMVLRLLNKDDSTFDISMINFSEENKQKFLDCIKKPSGIMLITGPTGSGKSSTLYAAISEINSIEKCIVTAEDPVEYKIAGIVQVQVNYDIGRTFPACLRELLRQDPDIILIGEIRDKETAETAMAASNTGHLIFSTLHTNNAVSAIVRLMDMGIEPYMVSSTINGIVSQRLLRRICNQCKTEYFLEKTSPFRKILNCGDDEVVLFKGNGCGECNYTGYSGRIAVHEFVVIDDELRGAILTGGTCDELQKIAMRNGMKTIMEDAIEKSLEGLTTLYETHRVLHFDRI